MLAVFKPLSETQGWWIIAELTPVALAALVSVFRGVQR